MSDYKRLDFNIQPINTDAADLLAAFLAEEDFETFEEIPTGVAAYIRSDLFNPQKIRSILADFPIDCNIDWTVETIEHQDWNEEWEKKYFKPIVIGEDKCVIHSSFHKDFPKAKIDITIDPKMAFGTGHHATTLMMVNFLFELELREKKIIDMGTGTGILAIVAKKLGAGNTIGIEIDPCAYENALENIKLNHVDPLLLQGDARLLKGIKDIDIFLANINRNIIIEDMEAYISVLKTSGHLLLSGFYLKDIPLLEEVLKEKGMVIKEIKNEGEWAAIDCICG